MSDRPPPDSGGPAAPTGSSAAVVVGGQVEPMTKPPPTTSAAERQSQCSWCDSDVRAREDGGRAQRFCRPSCRQGFHQALRRWSLHKWDAGQISITALRRLRAP